MIPAFDLVYKASIESDSTVKTFTSSCGCDGYLVKRKM